jgi:hypothetical protein
MIRFSSRKTLALGVGLAAALYVAYPYAALHALVAAVDSGDPARLEPKVDWPAVRRGFKDDLNSAMAAKVGDEERSGSGLAVLGMALGAKLMGGLVDVLVTPQGLAGMIEEGRRDRAAAAAIGGASGLSVPPAAADDGPKHSRIVWAFFDGPASFAAQVQGAGQAAGEPPVRIRLELEGGAWVLTRVFLPVDQTTGVR